MNINSGLSYNCLEAAKVIWKETQAISYISIFSLLATHFYDIVLHCVILYYIVLYYIIYYCISLEFWQFKYYS